MRPFRETWARFWTLVADSGEGDLEITKVKARATREDVRQAAWQRAGNYAVNEAARETVRRHPLDEAHLEEHEGADPIAGRISKWIGRAMQLGVEVLEADDGGDPPGLGVQYAEGQCGRRRKRPCEVGGPNCLAGACRGHGTALQLDDHVARASGIRSTHCLATLKGS